MVRGARASAAASGRVCRVKYLIVNGDDFGGSHGINRGMLEAHRNGILTSTSLFVDRPSTEEAVAMAREASDLGVGLHADLDRLATNQVPAELLRQLARFEELMGRPPSHLDSHHNVHQFPDVLPLVRAIADERGLILRASSNVRYVSEFYGQRSGRTDLLTISPSGLCAVLRTRLQDGATELGCHPGYVDAGFVSTYSMEREHELATLCDPTVREVIAELGVVLLHFGDLARVSARGHGQS